MNFAGTGQRLSGEDFWRAAAQIGCEEAAIRAVCLVEARGSGFDAASRPIILYEPHVMYRNTTGAERSRAVGEGLAYAKWRPGNYPATQDGRYDQVNRATAINAASGLMATSWGIGQVLGENFRLCGFATPQDMVARCVDSEGGQLDVMVAFILGKGLGKHIIRRDWAAFAEGYNGAAYAENQYDLKLKRAFERLSAGMSAAYDPLSDGLLALGDKGEVVKALQKALGIHADGDFGPMTQQAVSAYQRRRRLLVDGKVGAKTGGLLGLPYWQ